MVSGLIYNQTYRNKNVKNDPKENKDMLVYKFTSPIQKEYIKKKVLMFTISTPIMEFPGTI